VSLTLAPTISVPPGAPPRRKTLAPPRRTTKTASMAMAGFMAMCPWVRNPMRVEHAGKAVVPGVLAGVPVART
jgi:hypothetical protein